MHSCNRSCPSIMVEVLLHSPFWPRRACKLLFYFYLIEHNRTFGFGSIGEVLDFGKVTLGEVRAFATL